jgi:hypothetical protein
MVSVAISSGNVAALNYFIAEKYLKAFGELAKSPNQKILMLPIEATSVLSSLAGIAEIAKSSFGGGGGDGGGGGRGVAPARPSGPSSPSATRPASPFAGPAIAPPSTS